MTADRSGETIRSEAAKRYAQWVREEMALRGWNQAELARRAGLKKQTVGQIVKAGSTQPTAWQVAALARTFRIDPNEIFEMLGLWDSSLALPRVTHAEVGMLYQDLGFIERRALLRVGEALREVRAEYTEMLRGEGQAAYDRPELAEQERQDAEGWTRGEQP